MLRQFSREQKSDRGLDFARRDRSPLVLMSKSRRFASDSLEDVVDKGVHDAHCSAWNSNIGMHLLQNSVDETTITFLSRSLSLHHLRSSLATFASFLRRTFLCRALSWALHRRWLTTSTHFDSVSFTWNWCQPMAMKSGNEASEGCGRYLWAWFGSKSDLKIELLTKMKARERALPRKVLWRKEAKVAREERRLWRESERERKVIVVTSTRVQN